MDNEVSKRSEKKIPSVQDGGGMDQSVSDRGINTRGGLGRGNASTSPDPRNANMLDVSLRSQESQGEAERPLHLCLQLFLGMALFSSEMVVTYELIYMVTFEKLMGLPTKYISLPGLVSASISIFFLPLMGRFGDGGSWKMVRKMAMVIVSGCFQIGGAMLLLGSCVMKLNLPTNTTGTEAGQNVLCDVGGNTSACVYEVTETAQSSSSSVPVEALLTMLSFSLMDVGFDTGSSNVRAFLLESVPSAYRERVLSLGVLLSGLGGCTLGLVGLIDFSTVFGISGNSLAVKGIFLSSAVAITICICQPISFLLGWYIKRRYRSDGDTDSASEDGCDLSLTTGSDVSSDRSYSVSCETPKTTCGEKVNAFFKRAWQVIVTNKPLMALCVLNFFVSCTVICFEVYFSDFLAEGVYDGNPDAPAGSQEKQNFDDGMETASLGTLVFMASFFAYNLFHGKVVELIGPLVELLIATIVMPPLLVAFSYTESLYVFYPLAVWNGIYRALIFTTPYVLASKLASEGQGTSGVVDDVSVSIRSTERQPLLASQDHQRSYSSQTSVQDGSRVVDSQTLGKYRASDNRGSVVTPGRQESYPGESSVSTNSSLPRRRHSRQHETNMIAARGRRSSFTVPTKPRLDSLTAIEDKESDAIDDDNHPLLSSHGINEDIPEHTPSRQNRQSGKRGGQAKPNNASNDDNQGTVISIVFAMVPGSYLLLSAVMGVLLDATNNLATPLYFGAACDVVAFFCLIGLIVHGRSEK